MATANAASGPEEARRPLLLRACRRAPPGRCRASRSAARTRRSPGRRESLASAWHLACKRIGSSTPRRVGSPRAEDTVQRQRVRPSTSELSAWHRAEEAAAQARRALQVAREQQRVARLRAADRRDHLQAARAAGQEAFALGLRHAAEAHEVAARKADESCAALAAHLGALEALADRAADRARRATPVHPAPWASCGAACGCGKTE